MNRVVISRVGEVRAIIEFPGGSLSERMILPGADGSRVKVTLFHGCKDFAADGIVYDCDATCMLLDGEITLHLTDEEDDVELRAGDIWHVPAGTVYGLTATTDLMVLVVQSPGPDGTLPDDD